MSTGFKVRSQHGAIVVAQSGSLKFDETNQAIAAAAQAARAAQTNLILFDLRRAQLVNYYSYTVRHAQIAPRLGLDTGFRLAFVGSPDARDILSFMTLVAGNHGWTARHFFDMAAAFAWLREGLEAREGGSAARP